MTQIKGTITAYSAICNALNFVKCFQLIAVDETCSKLPSKKNGTANFHRNRLKLFWFDQWIINRIAIGTGIRTSPGDAKVTARLQIEARYKKNDGIAPSDIP